MSKFLWVLFVVLAIGIGLYPLIYVISDVQGGILSSKSAELLAGIWMIAFYVHILAGGLALLIGWPQFSSRLRAKRMSWHRSLGNVYLIAVMISGVAGLYLAFHATGGWVAKTGFGILAIGWLFTSYRGWSAVRKRDIPTHRVWMIRSYALCFAAVMLRIWLPLFMISGMPFLTAYVIIAWLCWVPNTMIAEWIIHRSKKVNVIGV